MPEIVMGLYNDIGGETYNDRARELITKANPEIKKLVDWANEQGYSLRDTRSILEDEITVCIASACLRRSLRLAAENRRNRENVPT